MNKREAMFRVLDGTLPEGYTPAAFFLHFDPEYHRGKPAVDKHLEYFRYTDMDFVKIQYEHKFPVIEGIKRPEDWAKLPVYDRNFFAVPLEVVKGLVESAKAEALIIVTLYSPFMCAGHASADGLLTEHLRQDPEAVKPALEAATASLLNFVRGCIDLGVDGFYTSTQGGEAHRFADRSIFEDYIKPTDLVLMEEINRRCDFNILHVCDYHDSYDELTPFLDYPGHVVNCSQRIGGVDVSMTELARLFDRPFMGGMDRHGVIAQGNEAEILVETQRVLDAAPSRFILGADCTVPSDTSWTGIRTAIGRAHGE